MAEHELKERYGPEPYLDKNSQWLKEAHDKWQFLTAAQQVMCDGSCQVIDNYVPGNSEHEGF